MPGGYSKKQLLISVLGLIFIFGGIGTLGEDGFAVIGGLLWMFSGLVILPQSRIIILDLLAEAGGPNLSSFGTVAVAALAVMGVLAGAAFVPSTTASDSPRPTVGTPPSTPKSTADPAASTTAAVSPTAIRTTLDTSTQTPTPTPSVTQSTTATITITPTPTPTPTPTATETATPTPTPTATARGPQASWTVTVIEVTDGDTMDVRMPDGSRETIRLLGVDAPETYSSTDLTKWEGIPDTVDGRDWLAQWGDQVTAYAEERLAGQDIYIEVDEQADRRGPYDRLLVYVYHSQISTTSFNRRLIENGYARLYDTSFSKRSAFVTVETAAQSGDVGVWDYSEPGPTVTPTASDHDGIAIIKIHEDAEGDEYTNLDDEYIIVANTGIGTIDMSGWTLSDGANHVYTFPTGVSLDSGETVRVVTGSGSDTASTLFWDQAAPVWNNNGDTVIVKTDSGETVAERSYN